VKYGSDKSSARRHSPANCLGARRDYQQQSRSEAYQQRSVLRSHSRVEIIDLDSAQGGMCAELTRLWVAAASDQIVRGKIENP
jgi:hypothetical protein